MDSMLIISKTYTPPGRCSCCQKTLNQSAIDYRASSQAYEHRRNNHRSNDVGGQSRRRHQEIVQRRSADQQGTREDRGRHLGQECSRGISSNHQRHDKTIRSVRKLGYFGRAILLYLANGRAFSLGRDFKDGLSSLVPVLI